LTFAVILAAGPVLARPGSGGSRSGGGSGGGFHFPGFGSRPPSSSSQTPTIQGTITALTAAAGTNPATLQVTDRNGLSIILKLAATTQITRDGRTAAFADLKVNDGIQVTYDRTTLVASRIIATSPPPVQVTGFITALNVNPVQPAPPAPAVLPTLELTTDHGTAVTLTANNSTRVTLNGRLTTLASLALGDGIRVSYRTSDKLALTADATTPPLNSISGAITALTLTGATGSLSLTPLVGTVKIIPLTAQTRFLLNGRAVTPATVIVGYLATVTLNNDGSAALVSAQTPPLVDLQGTISALTASTVEVTTPALTKITLRLASTTAITRNGAALSATNVLKVGDSLVVRYEYRLIPGQSNALQIAATGP
jgi:hypothetical protein